MNYYNHHLGDYDGATAHVSWDEDMAYTRLMRVYYRREEPIPNDMAAVCRLVRATNRPQREATERILSEFFEIGADGCWHNKRCDEEIARAREDGAENAAKRENERERQRRHRERRKQLFDALRERGVVPKWDTSLDQLEALLSQQQQRDNNAPVTRTRRDKRRDNNAPETANQEPRANSQEPRAKSQNLNQENSKSKALDSTSPTRGNGHGESPEPLNFFSESRAQSRASDVDANRETARKLVSGELTVGGRKP